MTVAAQGVEYYLRIRGDADKEADAISRSLTKLGVNAKEAKAAAMGIGATVSVFVAASAAAVAYADDVTSAIDRLNTLSGSTGLAIETVAGLELAAQASGKELSQLVPKDLAKRILEARQGTGEALKGFEALEMTVKGKLNPAFASSDEVLRATIDNLMAIEDPTKRAGIAIQVLGENGSEMLTAFGDSGDLDAFVEMAREFNNVSPEALRITAEWQQATTLMSLALTKLKSDMLPLVDVMSNTVRGLAAMAVGAKAFVKSGGTIGNIVPGFKAAAAEVAAFAEDVRAMNDELARTNEEVEKAAANRGKFTSDGDMAKLAASNKKAADKALKEQEAREKKAAEERKRRAAQQAREDARDQRRRDLLAASTSSVGGRQVNTKHLFGEMGDELEGLIEDLVLALEDVEGELQRAADEAAEQADRVASEDDTFRDGVSAFSLAMGSVVDIANIVGGAAGMVRDVTQSLQTLPNQVKDLANSVPELIDAIAGLPPELIRASPEIALAIADAMLSVAMAHVQVVGEALGFLFEQLPGDIAAEIAEALKNLTGQLNPFDGDGRFLGGLGAGVGGGDPDFLGVDIPFLNGGGDITKDGLAYVHKPEVVGTPEQMRQRFGGQGSSFNFGGIHARDPRDFMEQLQRMVGPYGGGGALVGAAGLGG